MKGRASPASSTAPHAVVVRELGSRDYLETWRAMQEFTASRHADTPDELWLTEHPPVFTLGQAGKVEHLLAPGGIPVLQSDRGGQVTYHGPGQLVFYVLFDLARRGSGVRALVRMLEASVIALLAEHGIAAHGRVDAPGVYVGTAKVAALGLRVRHGRTYHGLSFNADMDLEPFSRIHPCGYQGLAVTDARRLGIPAEPVVLRQALCRQILEHWSRLAVQIRTPREPALDPQD